MGFNVFLQLIIAENWLLTQSLMFYVQFLNDFHVRSLLLRRCLYAVLKPVNLGGR